MFSRGRLIMLRLCIAGMCFAVAACSQENSRDISAETTFVDWSLHGNDHGEQRFSQLASIDDGKVYELGLAWR